MTKKAVATRPNTHSDPRWVKYWSEIRFQKQLGKRPSDARRIAWERAFGKEECVREKIEPMDSETFAKLQEIIGRSNTDECRQLD